RSDGDSAGIDGVLQPRPGSASRLRQRRFEMTTTDRFEQAARIDPSLFSRTMRTNPAIETCDGCNDADSRAGYSRCAKVSDRARHAFGEFVFGDLADSTERTAESEEPNALRVRRKLVAAKIPRRTSFSNGVASA